MISKCYAIRKTNRYVVSTLLLICNLFTCVSAANTIAECGIVFGASTAGTFAVCTIISLALILYLRRRFKHGISQGIVMFAFSLGCCHIVSDHIVLSYTKNYHVSIARFVLRAFHFSLSLFTQHTVDGMQSFLARTFQGFIEKLYLSNHLKAHER